MEPSKRRKKATTTEKAISSVSATTKKANRVCVVRWNLGNVMQCLLQRSNYCIDILIRKIVKKRQSNSTIPYALCNREIPFCISLFSIQWLEMNWRKVWTALHPFVFKIGQNRIAL